MRGGLRARLVVDSIRVTVIAGLGSLGWFDATIHDVTPGLRRHLPLRYINRPNTWDERIQANAFAISTDDISDEPQSLGGDVEDNIAVYIDLFAQSSELGWQLATDIRDILLGRLPDMGRNGPVVDIYDLRQSPPTVFTHVDIENIQIDRAQSEARDWQEFWFMIRLDVVDDYADEYDAVHATTTWAADYADAWTRIQTPAAA